MRFTNTRLKVILCALSVCIVVAVVFLLKISSDVGTNTDSESEKGEVEVDTEEITEPITWSKDRENRPSHFGTYNYSKRGNVFISSTFETVFLYSEPSDVITIKVVESTGVLNKDVYEKFILKQDIVAEEFRQKGVIYATKEQMESMVCPEDIAIHLLYTTKITRDNGGPLDLDFLNLMEEERLMVSVEVSEGEKSYNYLVNEYQISDKEIIDVTYTFSVFRIHLCKDTIKLMLMDPKITSIFLLEDELIEVY